MNDWIEIKTKILFSHFDCDWTSISVDKIETKQIKEYLDKNVNLKIESDGIFAFDIFSIKVFFYLNSAQNFDFDPKLITTENDWNNFLCFFKKMSLDLKSIVLIQPEDSLLYENILVKISNSKAEYDFEIYDTYKNASG